MEPAGPADEPGSATEARLRPFWQVPRAFSTTGEHERSCTLAFARSCSVMLLADGSIGVAGQGRMNVGQAVDREAVLNDIRVGRAASAPDRRAPGDRKWSGWQLPRVVLTQAALWRCRAYERGRHASGRGTFSCQILALPD